MAVSEAPEAGPEAAELEAEPAEEGPEVLEVGPALAEPVEVQARVDMAEGPEAPEALAVLVGRLPGITPLSASAW